MYNPHISTEMSEGLDHPDQVSHMSEPEGSYGESCMLVEGNPQD